MQQTSQKCFWQSCISFAKRSHQKRRIKENLTHARNDSIFNGQKLANYNHLLLLQPPKIDGNAAKKRARFANSSLESGKPVTELLNLSASDFKPGTKRSKTFNSSSLGGRGLWLRQKVSEFQACSSPQSQTPPSN